MGAVIHDAPNELIWALQEIERCLEERKLRERQYLDTPPNNEKLHDARLLRLNAVQMMY